ncbi:MAG TPA: hypothetical protein VIL05_12805 [Thermoclostridium sp.]
MVDYVLNASKDKDCLIIYMKGTEITQRKIHVIGIDADHVRAYCYLRNGPRVFLKKNILAASFC